MTKNNLITSLLVKSGDIGKWIGWLLIYLIGSSLLSFATIATSPQVQNEFLFAFIIVSGLTLFAIIYYYRIRIKNDPYLRRNKLSVGNAIKWFGLVILMMLIQNIWQLLITHQIISEPNNQQIIEQQVQALPFWNQFYDSLIAPIFEEIIFRGLFFNYFIPRLNKAGKIIGLIISSCIFGYLHELNLDLTMVMYSMLGLILGITYLYFKDIRYSIGLHIFNNVSSLL